MQAALAVTVVGALLFMLAYQAVSSQVNARDEAALTDFTMLTAQAVRAGVPVDQPVRELDARGGPLAGRVALVDGRGTLIAGAQPEGKVRAEQPVRVNGQTLARAQIVRSAPFGSADRNAGLLLYLGIGAILLLLLAALLGSALVLARRWSRPQIELHRLSREIAHGDHELSFEDSGPPEIAGTMRNLRRIASQFSRIEAARRTWLVSVSSELKRPAENMGEHFIALCALEPPLPTDLLAGIEDDTKRLIHMAEDLSAVALADLGRLPVSLGEADARGLVDHAIAAHRDDVEAQGVRIERGAFPVEAAPVKWDVERIAQAFHALIANSLRFTPKGGKIAIGLERSREAWRLVVDDSAPGIDVMLAQRLFEPFYRSSDRSDEAAASGLGLATARAIVEAHHGRIEAARSPIGGLRVTIILPANPPTI
ncbi:sensor histidine kinase [Sphingomonas sp. MMS12-HWE2-04]|uniref:sensor histidine kinase n=1 Tax=Sphingomonas sp. MMS12-HWE2-04 TaxID=3234199 RepID=UPI00384FCE2C